MSTTTSYTQPALYGGLVMGALSALPFVNFANCCCLWVISGGVLAAYILQQNEPRPIEPGDGAIVGLLAGLAGAVVWLVLSIPLDLITAPIGRALMERWMEMADSMPPEVADALERMNEEGGLGAAGFVFGKMLMFVFFLFLGAIFSTLGGLLGAAMFRKASPPGGAAPPAGPGVIDVPPAP